VLRRLLQYLLALGISAGLLWFVYKDIDFEEAILLRLREVDYFWVLLSVCLSLLAFYLRAVRWNMLLHPLGFAPSNGRTFLALMTGYVANIFVPRMGEVTRCGVLRRTDRVPMSSSFGTVVAERVFDLIVLLVMVLLGLVLEFDKLSDFIRSYFEGQRGGYEGTVGTVLVAGLAAAGLLLIALLLLRLFRHRLRRSPLLLKIRSILRSVAEGFLSVRRLQRPGVFWGSTAGIWGLYFAMAYVMFYAIPQTSQLSPLAGLLVLIMGGLGMSAPVQGGFGTYHAFVSSALLLYGVAELDGKFFAFLMHSSQVITVLTIGAISAAVVPFIRPPQENRQPVSDGSAGDRTAPAEEVM
jgi:glycosyltransferase 2 family protein